MVLASETTVTMKKSLQYGEKPNQNDDVELEPQVKISDKSRSVDYSNRGEKAGVMTVQ